MARTKTKRALVTGAAGFIGSNLCDKLIDEGWHVTGLDNFNNFYSPAAKRRNLSRLDEHKRFELIKGDVCNQKLLREILGRRTWSIVHLAAMAGVRPSMENPGLYQKVNVQGTGAVLEASRQSRVDHLVFGSSSSIYGNYSRVPFKESDPATRPVSVYAATKRAGELLCHAYHDAYNMNITVLRFFTVYGPRQRPDLAIHKFSRLILEGEPIPVFGDGSMERDYTYVDDIVDGILKTLAKPEGLQTYNLGSDRPIKLTDLIKAIESAVGRPAKIKQKAVPVGDVERTWADLTLSRRQLGYRPSTTLDEGLAAFVDWLISQPRVRSRRK